MKWNRGFTILLFTALVIVAPSAQADESADGLAKQVTIRRDTYGVPHILADTEAAAAYGYGYAVAEDHAEEMARLYLKARAEEAKYFGGGFAKQDFRMLHYRVYEVAEEGYAKTPAWFREVLDGFAAGFNRYIAKGERDFPAWVQPISGTDVLAYARTICYMEFDLNIRELDKAPKAAVATPGSNGFAIGKERSASGDALLLGNPHLAWFGSHIWHELHMLVPGKLNVHGAALLGSPGINVGFNEHLGWTHTVNPHDSDDVYELTLDPDDGKRYLFDGESRPMTARQFSIEVMKDDETVTKTETRYTSHLGPVVRFTDEKAYAVKTPNLDEWRSVEQWNMMAKAKSYSEFRDALDIQGLSMFNVVYADREGSCFYLFGGRFPECPAGYDWRAIVPGNTSATAWTGILPVDKLPQLLNPKGAYVHNSNNAPWYTNVQAVIDKSAFPPWLCSDNNGLRSQHGLSMLEADDSITFDEMLDYKNSMRLLLADRVKDDLVALTRGETRDGVDLDRAAQVLAAWDNTASRESRGSVLFVRFWDRYHKRANKTFREGWSPDKMMSTPYGIGDPEAALEQLAVVITRIEKSYGAIDVPWGEVYRHRRGDVDVPLGGATGELGAYRVIHYLKDRDGKMVARGGDSYVFAVAFSDPIRAKSVMAYSQSSVPGAPHHDDQTALFANRGWKDVWFYEDGLKDHIEREYRP